MFAEFFTYLVAFISTSGIAVIGILTSYQVFQKNKKNVFQLLLYQQIFLFSFFIYSIWGNLALRKVLTEALIYPEHYSKLAVLIPMLGVPFLVLSWFMLIKFSFNLNQYRVEGRWIYIYFTGFIVLLSGAVYLFQTGHLPAPSNPDNFLARVFIPVNLLFHLLFFVPFIKPKSRESLGYKRQEMHKCLIIYMGGLGLLSIIFWFLGSFGYVYSAFSFVVLFASGALLPVCINFNCSFAENKPAQTHNNFASFCKTYNISKRESEIVLEICDGKTNKAIAEKLFITLQTVKDHTHRIYTKTNVKSRVQLANLVREKTGKK